MAWLLFSDRRLLSRLDDWGAALATEMVSIQKDIAAMARTLIETRDEVRSLRTKVDSYNALFDGIKQQLIDALANHELTPEQQAIIEETFDEAKAASDVIDEDLNANTGG